jgi:hypothetical protein
MRNHISAVLILSQLVGCTTLYDLEMSQLAPPPNSPPKIILGQDATIWFPYNELDLEVTETWRKTGLFKSVTPAKNTTIPLTGTFILTSCDSSYRTDDEFYFTLPLVSIMTAFVMPMSKEINSVRCETNFYQSGKWINQSSMSYYRIYAGNSWFMALANYPEKRVIREQNTSIATNIVSSSLVSLKKAFP